MKTIKSCQYIDYIFKNGKKINLPFFIVLYVQAHDCDDGRVAFIAGKKNGNAVWRNKSKRIMREVYREIGDIKNFDILIIAKKPLQKFQHCNIVNLCSEAFNRYEIN